MSLPRDLLEQADHLVQREGVGAPRQASLRRSVSAAYYALFHLLVDEASSACSPTTPPELRLRVQRAFDHGKMKQVCKFASGGTLPAHVSNLLAPKDKFPAAIQQIAKTFLQLQEARHAADYDPAQKHTRSDAKRLIQNAEQAFSSWTVVKGTAEANVFLTALLLHDRWDR